MVTDRTFISAMCIPCGKTFPLLLRSRSSVKVKDKYQAHILKKMDVAGAFVFQKHILLGDVLEHGTSQLWPDILILVKLGKHMNV